MKKILILSGKGGTGKTTTAAAFIAFSNAKAFADCDVDAPNLHLVNEVQSTPITKDFIGSKKAKIDPTTCIGCNLCYQHCRFDAIKQLENRCEIDEYACEGCGVCEYVCPQGAISLEDDVAGKLTRYQEDKVFVSAKLKMGRGNSGKLVTEVKKELSQHADADIAIIDGSPGIGCPVIASITGVDLVLVVAEPSNSGISDLKRLVKTANQLQTKLVVAINKWDQSEMHSDEIIDYCQTHKIPFMGKVPYDKHASIAMNQGKSIANIDCKARAALYDVYQHTMEVLG